MRKWTVQDLRGNVHVVEADYGFNNPKGLCFRRVVENRGPNDPKTQVVAEFAYGKWDNYKEITDGK